MRNTLRHRCIGIGLPLLVTLACAPDPPASPSWDQDVFPILRGNCLHCHGETAGSTAMLLAWRFDVCNNDLDGFVAVGVRPETDALQHIKTIIGVIKPNARGRAAMPPSPAYPLLDYEVAVLSNWQGLADKDPRAACQKAAPNRPPGARLVQSAAVAEGWAFDVDVFDPDGEQVFGRATLGTRSAEILSSGRRRLIATGPADVVTLTLTDGYDVATVTLP